KFFIAAVIGFMMLLVSSHVFAQADKRQALMKSNSANAKAIKAAVEAKDYATIETKAKEIMANGDKIVGLFPKGSDTGKTKATAAIWDKPDDFAKNAKSLSKAASELADAAKAKDDAAIAVKVKALGDVCGNCHKTFRAEKYAE
ncbi:MAG TPA: cytochrome c, partial [Candidatus Binatia bacterium]|nr:cytochrome c [Candidatus Binatia bacterium]